MKTWNCDTGQITALVWFFIVGSLIALTSAAKYVEPPKYSCPLKSKIIFPCICLNGTDDGLYVRCENTNLASLSVALQNLAALGNPIEQLTISKGHFEKMYGPMFSKIKARLLTITETNLKHIEDYTFFGINKTLEQVHIQHSNLSTLSPLTFGILGKLTHLVIDGHMLEKLDKNLFFEQEISNRLEVLRISNGLLSDIPIESFQPLRKLKLLDLHGNQLTALKRNQFKNLREVENLDISFNGLKKLEAQHIADLTKLGWCNVSNNALTELSRGTFARNSVLKVLNLAHNNITRLDGNSFRGMRFLRRLFLNDNKISDVGRGTFGSLTRIGTIDLARNELQKVEYQMFSELNYVEVVDVAENNVKIVEKNSFKNIYQAKINLSHNAIEKIETNAFENCVNITVLDLSFNNLRNFSRNSFDITTFATEFQVAHNMLTDLGQVPLQNMTGLKVLNASYNNIEKIPKNCFPKLYELHTIDVSHNNISFIANGVFQPLFSMRSLNISHNSLENIKSSMFGTLPTLLELDLSHNNLSDITRGALAKCTSVRYLALHNNRLEKLFQIPISLNELHMHTNHIKSVPPGTWPVMNALLLLDLSNNEIGDTLEDNSFKGLLVLQRLFLNNNNISRPPLASLAGMSTLQYLHLEYNNISTLEKSAFGKLPVLFELNLHKNSVNDISKRAFDGLLQLLVLNLSANALKTIPNEAFVGLPSLRKLDLSFNMLSKFDNKTHGVLDDLLSLEHLNLRHNKISFVTKKTFPSNQYIPYNLQYVDLSYNQMPVLTYDITFGTKKLRKLDVSHNHINDLRRGVLSNFTALEVLDISNNELSNLVSEEHIFDVPKNLKEIYLQNNQIYRLPFEQFLKEPKMSVIDLRNNSLEEFPLSLLWNIKNETKVLFSGNPLICNCGTRPLKHYMLSQTNLDADMKDITCALPIHIYDVKLINIQDESLQCTQEDNTLYKGELYDVLPDIRFRDIMLKNKNLTTTWYVSSPIDIADFTMFIRNNDNTVLFQSEYPYNTRVAQTPITAFTNESISNVEYGTEVCIIARNSKGDLGRWFNSQCKKLPRTVEKRNWFLSVASAATSTSFWHWSYIGFQLTFIVLIVQY